MIILYTTTAKFNLIRCHAGGEMQLRILKVSIFGCVMRMIRILI